MATKLNIVDTGWLDLSVTDASGVQHAVRLDVMSAYNQLIASWHATAEQPENERYIALAEVLAEHKLPECSPLAASSIFMHLGKLVEEFRRGNDDTSANAE